MNSYIIVSKIPNYNNEYFEKIYTNESEEIKKVYMNCISFSCRVHPTCMADSFFVMIGNSKNFEFLRTISYFSKYDIKKYPFFRFSNCYQTSNDIHINKTVEVEPGNSLYLSSNNEINYSIEIKEL
ncbi:hypothetical protein BCR32DRAFT_251385 [Anaeromyces robustus]|uniref:Uncharacterized protein n=1 Tax=Anaeromyces robustus TaxID=1754192 RepID=A0A1Y1VRF4_9FUNG|nr:hypothetical protein BCR32DRAFT_251385 [Anaeromyces robustus]|eukprot:ORX63871.1 hypothetical protein BCR32DRAFT_251385 [Anaeromyces robustus]